MSRIWYKLVIESLCRSWASLSLGELRKISSVIDSWYKLSSLIYSISCSILANCHLTVFQQTNNRHIFQLQNEYLFFVNVRDVGCLKCLAQSMMSWPLRVNSSPTLLGGISNSQLTSHLTSFSQPPTNSLSYNKNWCFRTWIESCQKWTLNRRR